MNFPHFTEENDSFYIWLDSKANSYRIYNDGYNTIEIVKVKDKYYIHQSPFILSKCFTWVLDTHHSRDNYQLYFDTAWEAYDHFYKFIKYDQFLICHTPMKPQNITKNIVQYIIEESRKAPDESRSNSRYHSGKQTS